MLGLLDLAPKLWGEGWARTEVAKLASEGGARFNLSEMVRIFSATKINLNIHSANHVEGLDPDPDYVNPRTFELASCGAFQLVDARLPLPDLFAEDEVVTFRSTAELRDLIRYYLAHPDERAAAASRASARARADHTFVHRVRRIFDETLPAPLLKSVGSPAKASGLDSAIESLARTSPKMVPEEAMMRVLRHVRDGVL
jgi:spore maturation protein CgeB